MTTRKAEGYIRFENGAVAEIAGEWDAVNGTIVDAAFVQMLELPAGAKLRTAIEDGVEVEIETRAEFHSRVYDECNERSNVVDTDSWEVWS